MTRPRRVRASVAAVRLSFLAFLIFGLYLVYAWVDLQALLNPQRIVDVLQRLGPLAPLVLILVMAAAVVISPIPSLPLDVAAGIVFGPALGTFYAVVGAEIGAIMSFWIGRALGREALTRLLRTDIRLCEHCSDRYLVGFILLARLFPVFSFDLVSYGAGLTNISFRAFALATLIGMIPPTLALTAFGSGLVWADPTLLVPGLLMVGLLFLVPFIVKRFPALRNERARDRQAPPSSQPAKSPYERKRSPACVSCGQPIESLPEP